MPNLQVSPRTPELIEQVIDSGLFAFDDESHFSWHGCEHCADGLGAEVYDLRGYRSLESRELYEFQVCGDCLHLLYYPMEGN